VATLEAHMTELKAVNQMLRSISEQPVSQLGSGQIDSDNAEEVLEEVSRRIQSQGWHANARRGVVLPVNASFQFAVGTNVLKVDTVNPTSPRRTASPKPSAYYDVALRRSIDDTKWILYDVDNDTETWASGPATLTVDIIEFLPFQHLPVYLQAYIYKAAAHEFQKSTVASQILFQFTQEEVEYTMVYAVQCDSEMEDRNMIRNHAGVQEVAYRYNPLYGT